MTTRRTFYLLFFLGLFLEGSAQNIRPFLQKNHPDIRKVYKLDIQQDSFINLHSAIRKFQPISRIDSTNRKGLFNTFYKSPECLYRVDIEGFSLGINFLFDFRVGQELEGDETIYLNKRGIELFGRLDKKFYFYSSYEENQSNFLNYLNPNIEKYKTIRGRGNYKPYQSSIFDSVNGYDYGFATAYLGYNITKHTVLELGHSRHFIGNGIRSLLLSDSGNNYFNLRFNVNVWRLNYQTIIAELSSISARFNVGNTLLPKKYMANHYLSIKPRHNIEIGLFEAIVFSRENNFELQYLNPVIFYRTLEHQLDSPDNVLLGLNGKWNLWQRFSFYGQFILDDLNVSELFDSNGWWGNKYGYQLGLKYVDAFSINNLEFIFEYNQVRPYTYSHWQTGDNFKEISISNYSHFNQPLAHPLGANFREALVQVAYVPNDKFSFLGRYFNTTYGKDDGANFGYDILTPNISRTSDFGIEQGQGLATTINSLEILAAYEIWTNLYLDLNLKVRSESNLIAPVDTRYFGIGLRYNSYRAPLDY